MFGTFQQSNLRIEIDASSEPLRQSLTEPSKLREWLKFQRFPSDLPDQLTPGLSFTSHTGFVIPIQHTVERIDEHHVRFLLSQGIDGYHAWAWGDGWVQSEIEGISLLPIGLGQTASLLLLRNYIQSHQSGAHKPA
jgi:hypothetical protein